MSTFSSSQNCYLLLEFHESLDFVYDDLHPMLGLLYAVAVEVRDLFGRAQQQLLEDVLRLVLDAVLHSRRELINDI